MKLSDIYKDRITKVFIVTEQDDDNELNWTIEETGFELIPEEENYYFVKTFEVSEKGKTECYIGIMTPERIAEIVIKQGSNGQTKVESIYDQEKSMLPSLLQDYYKYNYNGQIADHNHVANWYVGYISEALAAYDNNQHSMTYYEQLAWSGLSESTAYKSKNQLERDNISITYYNNIKTEPCKN